MGARARPAAPPPVAGRLRGDAEEGGGGGGSMEEPGGSEGLQEPQQQQEEEAAAPASPPPGVGQRRREKEAEAEAEAVPSGPSRALPARGRCLLGNWLEERATEELDRVPAAPPGAGPEGFFFRHGHRGLIAAVPLAGLAQKSSTMKDSYPRPQRSGLPARGQREAMIEWLLYQKYSKEVFEEDVSPLPGPMESLSTTHQDYRQEGFISVPPAPTQPHNYRVEQPQTYWLERAQQVPGVSCIRTGDTPFKKNATFSTPVTENLHQPLPCSPEEALTQ